MSRNSNEGREENSNSCNSSVTCIFFSRRLCFEIHIVIPHICTKNSGIHFMIFIVSHDFHSFLP